MGLPRGFHRSPVLPREGRWLAGRFAAALGLSLLVHGSVLGLVVARWMAGPASTSIIPVTLVDPAPAREAGAAGPVLFAQAAEPAEDPAAPWRLARGVEAVASESAAVASRLIEQGRQIGRELEHRREIAALENRNADLERRLTGLEAERDALVGEVAAAHARTARLEQAVAAERAKDAAALAEVRAAYEQLVGALRREIADKDVALEQARERLTVAIVDRVLFPSGQATLTPEGERVIDTVGTALAAVPDRRVLVEGHTDDMPIGPELSSRFPSNWELSTARATEVVKRLVARGQVPPGRLSAVGRADTDPAVSNATEDGRRRNRRIEIILLPPSPPGGDAPAS